MYRRLVTIALITTLVAGCLPRDGGVRAAQPGSSSNDSADPAPLNSDTEEASSRYFEMDQIGRRYSTLGESSADFGFGFQSRLILLNDSRWATDGQNRDTMHTILIETTPARYEEWPLIASVLPEGVLPLIKNAEARIVDSVSPVLGSWNDYFFVADHNRNGVDEIIVLRLGGDTYVPEFWEFREGELELVLDPYDHAAIVVAMEVSQPGKVTIYDLAYDRSDLPYLRQVFQWSEVAGRYEHVSAEPVNEFPE